MWRGGVRPSMSVPAPFVRRCLSWSTMAPFPHPPQCPLNVCAVTRRRFPVGASPARQPLQPEATGAVMEATKWLKPSRDGGSSNALQWTAGVRKYRSFTDGSANGSTRPFAAVQIHTDERRECANSGHCPTPCRRAQFDWKRTSEPGAATRPNGLSRAAGLSAYTTYDQVHP